MMMLLALAASVSASPKDAMSSAEATSPDYDVCRERASQNGGDGAQGECTRAEIARADAALNRLWPQIIVAAEGRNSEIGWALLEEQRAWIAYKSANCRHYYIGSAGTMETQLFGPWCELRTITDRTGYLEGVLTELGGSIEQ